MAFQANRIGRKLAASIFLIAVIGGAHAAASDTAAALRARHAALGQQLAQNQFGRPLVLDSTESASRLKGEVYAVVDHPIAEVSAALNSPTRWCDVLILHLNTKYCQAAAGDPTSVLKVRIGKKHDQPLDDAHLVEFSYRVASATPEVLDVRLSAPKGPLGTSNYRIGLEAVGIGNGKSFIHLSYSYDANLAARIAMQSYLATIGRGKVGFTVTGKGADGEPDYIGGVRGVVERNTMRYYLAIDAYLDALDQPPAAQLEKRLERWFASSEQYRRQLHEVDRAAYMDMKRNEYQRQQAAR